MLSSKRLSGRDTESGFVLLAVIFLTILLLISLAIAAPKVARSLQRDKDLETIHRGEQYRRAIKLYYQKFGSYPTSVDQLMETNQIRFLRKRYTDPETGKDDWKPVLYGHAHVHPLGFFGQPLMAVGMAGAMGGSMYAPAPTTTTDASGLPVASTGDDSSNPGAEGNAAGTPAPATNSPFSMNGQSTNPGGSSPFGSTPGSPTGTTSSSPFGSSTGSSASGTSASTFGSAGPIVGFTLPVDKPSLIDYMEQTRYNKWEFNYDPAAELAMAAAASTATNPAGGTTGTNGTTPGAGTATPGSGTPGASSGTTANPTDSSSSSPQ